MTKEHLISATTIADMDRNMNEYLPVGGETVTKNDAEPVIVTFDPGTVEGEWNYDHTFVAESPSTDPARAWRNDEPFNCAELEQPRQAIFEEHDVFSAPAFDPWLRVTEVDDTDHE